VSILVEAAVESLEDALAAVDGGADRLELCGDLSVGGVTPDDELVATVLNRVSVPVFTMIRPRGGSFVYSEFELKVMLASIERAREAGVHGVVFGVLDSRNRLDRGATETLVSAASGLNVTFHRAFDRIADREDALESLIEFGFHRVLTSAGAADALTGVDGLRELVDVAGDDIVILAGGGVRPHTAREIVEQSGVREVHARCEHDADRIRGIKRELEDED
jgi:copper homeostasis protein